MIFVWGEGVSGKVYKVPGVCYVGTVFFHIFFVPIFPYRSYIVVNGTSPKINKAIERGSIRQSSYGFWGIRIPLSKRSVFMGLTRGFLGFIAAVFSLMSLPEIIEAYNGRTQKGHGPWDSTNLTFYGIVLGAAVLYCLTWLFTPASKAKAEELKAALGLGDHVASNEEAEPLSWPLDLKKTNPPSADSVDSNPG